MKVRRPSYVKDFQCIGSACTDTCCAGWEIVIDDTTYETYKQIKGAFGERLRQQIGEEQGEAYFKLQKGRRCSFLNQDNLCDIFIEIGEDKLCDICREHPRYYEWFGNYTEMGVGLCCEAAERLIFSSEQKTTFELLVEGEEDEEEDVLITLLLQARETAFAIVQNRDYVITDRLIMLLDYGRALQSALDRENIEEIEVLATQWKDEIFLTETRKQNEKCRITIEEGVSYYGDILDVYERLEILDTSWKETLHSIRVRLRELIVTKEAFDKKYAGRAYEYEHLAVYFLYRYFMQAVYQDDITSPVTFTVLSVLMIALADRERYMQTDNFTIGDRYEIARRYSKEIEYCTENMDALADESWENEGFSANRIKSLLML